MQLILWEEGRSSPPCADPHRHAAGQGRLISTVPRPGGVGQILLNRIKSMPLQEQLSELLLNCLQSRGRQNRAVTLARARAAGWPGSRQGRSDGLAVAGPGPCGTYTERGLPPGPTWIDLD